MTDVERITTTERHAELREQIAQALRPWLDAAPKFEHAPEDVLAHRSLRAADAVLPFIEQAKAEVYEQARCNWPWMLTNAEVAAFNRGQAAGRGRVVEGLVATIKALESEPHGETHLHRLAIGRVLTVVEAAREDTT